MKKSRIILPATFTLGLLIILLVSCVRLPAVYKVKTSEIHDPGILFMLPKSEITLNFNVIRIDSSIGLISDNEELINKVRELYLFDKKIKAVKKASITYKLSDVQLIKKSVPDTSETYLLKINKYKNSIFTNMDFGLQLSDDGIIESASMEATNQSLFAASTLVSAIEDRFIPNVKSLSKSQQEDRGVSDTMNTYQIKVLLNHLIANKKRENDLLKSPINNDQSLNSYIISDLTKEDSIILGVLLGTCTSKVDNNFNFHIPNEIGIVYILKTLSKNGSYVINETYDSSSAANNYILKVKTSLLNRFSLRSFNKTQNLGFPFKLPERVKVEISNQSGQIIYSDEISITGKETYRLPNRFNALNSKLSIEYNSDGTINNISNSNHAFGATETNSIIDSVWHTK